jgi:uncharacterized protein (DUF433 family)
MPDNRSTSYEPVPVESIPGVCGGDPCIPGHRIEAALIYEKSLTMTVEQIVAEYPQLTFPAVLAAIRWIQEHPGYWHEWRRDQEED